MFRGYKYKSGEQPNTSSFLFISDLSLSSRYTTRARIFLRIFLFCAYFSRV